MPVRRPKSCDSCRAAKARCSLTAPCSRCAKRSIECNYAPTQHRRKLDNFRSIKPALCATSTTEVAGKLAPTATLTSHSCVGTILHDGAVATPSLTPTCSTAPWSTSASPGDVQQTFEWSTLYDSSLEPLSPSKELDALGKLYTFSSFPESVSPSWFLNNDTSMSNWPHTMPSPGILSSLEIPRSLPVPSPTHLTRRERSLQQGLLTAKLIFSRLTDYTRMMGDGKRLPPFIHPPCSLSGSDECAPDERHQCLPKTLAICANLTQMFHSRTAGSHVFVWQQICTHVRQMWAEVSSELR
jgi:hypothetical protein